MSKTIVLPIHSKLPKFSQDFLRQQAVKGAVQHRPSNQPITPDFNQTQDPLSYRDDLPVPHAAQIKTGFAFMDTCIRLIYEKKDDPKSPVRGIRFNSLGIEFRIEKSNVLGETPTYETTVITNEKDAQVSYRMTPQDIAYALACMAQECDLEQDQKLAKLYDLFKDRAPTFTPDQKSLETKTNPSNQEKTFEFAEGDKTYLVEVPQPTGTPKFWVKGFDAKNASKTRQMTRDEVDYTINKILADTSLDASVAIYPLITRMRKYSWSMTPDQTKDAGKINTEGTRAINLGY